MNFLSYNQAIADPLDTYWQTAFTEGALELGVPERASTLNKKIGSIIELQALEIPRETTHTYVGWDEGKVVEAKDPPLYSTAFASCVAVLARAIPDGDDQPSHLAMHHVFLKPQNLSATLKTLAEKVEKGKIEIFISAGLSDFIYLYHEIPKMIAQCQEQYPNHQFEIKDNTFGIADLGVAKKLINGQYYQEQCSVIYAGFDRQHRPYEVVHISNNHADPHEQLLWAAK